MSCCGAYCGEACNCLTIAASRAMEARARSSPRCTYCGAEAGEPHDAHCPFAGARPQASGPEEGGP